MNKWSPTYDLESVKALIKEGRWRMTYTSRRTLVGLGGEDRDVVFVFDELERLNFYKSVTSIGNSSEWQDVYHYDRGDVVLYIKFLIDSDGCLVLSFKEK